MLHHRSNDSGRSRRARRLACLLLAAGGATSHAPADPPKVVVDDVICFYYLDASHGDVNHDYTQGLWAGPSWELSTDPRIIQKAFSGWDELKVIADLRHKVGPHGEGVGTWLALSLSVDGSVEDEDVIKEKKKRRKDWVEHGEHVDRSLSVMVFKIHPNEHILKWTYSALAIHPCEHDHLWFGMAEPVDGLLAGQPGVLTEAIGAVAAMVDPVNGMIALNAAFASLPFQQVIAAGIRLGPPEDGGPVIFDLSGALADVDGWLRIKLEPTAISMQLAACVLAGDAYLSVSTLAYPGGELSGQLLHVPDCSSDLDGDGVVGIIDLLILLADWGNPSGILELLNLLASWGPCP
jgi:CHRD domain-containing protein